MIDILTHEILVCMRLLGVNNLDYLNKFNHLLDDKFFIVKNYKKCRGFPCDTLYRFDFKFYLVRGEGGQRLHTKLARTATGFKTD